MSGFYGNAITALVEVKSLRALNRCNRAIPEFMPGGGTAEARNPKYGTCT